MKNVIMFPVIASMMLLALCVSCKKADWKDLEYSDTSAFDWFQANVRKKGGAAVLWFQVFDQVDDKATIDGYRNSTEKVGKYPAKIFENKWIWIMVNNRIEIRLIADDKAKDFQNTEQLKKFIQSFDLAGMEKVAGPKLKGKDLEKFIPKLGAK